MDIQEIIKYSKNKIEADDLAKQVRRRIKETAWEKQNRREGFSETFKPLISQFERPEDSKKENIFTQNQEMLRNQLALTEGLRANQKAITEGFKQFERLADMKELPDEGWEKEYIPEPLQPDYGDIIYEEVENFFDEDEINFLENGGYPRPSEFYKFYPPSLSQKLNNLNKDIKEISGQIVGRKNNKNPSQEYVDETIDLKNKQETLTKYRKIFYNYLRNKTDQKGEGIMLINNNK